MADQVSNKKHVTVAIICFINLINYMDRFTVAGILYDIQESFGMTVTQGGLLQTSFILVYMFMAPLFGYLGDRFNRKWLLTSGILFWSLSTLLGSFMPNYWSFLVLRCLVGVGEASYTTIAPTIISDFFTGDKRSKMLSIFNFAIPVGAGLGYMLGSVVLYGVGSGMSEEERISNEVWRWGLRITPVLGVIAVLMIIFVLEEPARGNSEGGQHLQATSFTDDFIYLITNKAFVLNTLSFTFVTLVMGALAWWTPLYIALGTKVQESSNVPDTYVSLIFGAESMVAGLIGVPLGSYMGQVLRVKYPKADPLVCGIGILIAAPVLLAATFIAETNTLLALIICFIGQIFQNLNWSVVTDMMLYTVIPTRRSSASALMILVSHAFGDAGSPYVMGVIADAFKPLIHVDNTTLPMSTPMSVLSTTYTSILPSTTEAPDDGQNYIDFKSLQYSMAIITGTDLFATVFFIWLSFHIVKSKQKVDDAVKGQPTNVNGIVNEAYEKSSDLSTGNTTKLQELKYD